MPQDERDPAPSETTAVQRALPAWLRPDDHGFPSILGHRGAPRMHPENSIAGFLAAMTAGADGVELDVRMSSDEIPVVAHDPDLVRTHRERIHIRDAPAAALPLATLEDAVRAVRSQHPQARLDLELKEMIPPDVLEAVIEPIAPHDRVAVTSFELDIVRRYRRDGRFAVGWVLQNRRITAERVAAVIDRHDMDFLAVLNPVFLRSVVKAAHERDTAIWVWTANRRGHIMRAVRAHADAIITDVPDIAVAVREASRQ